MMPRRRRILITGFEPFGGSDDNPSARVVDVLSRDGPDGLITAILPVSARRMPGVLSELLSSHQPDVVVGLGEARGSAAVRVECVAVNRLDCRIADNDGVVLSNECVVPGGDASLDVSLPTGALVDCIRAAGVACERSDSAGAFMCNQMMYLALHWAARQLHRPIVGFLHLPSLPSQNTSDGVAAHTTMELASLVRATRAALDALASSPG